MVLLVTSCMYVCILFNIIFKIVYTQLLLPQFYAVFARNDPAHVSYTKVKIFVHVVLNISVLHVSKFSVQVAYLFGAPLW